MSKHTILIQHATIHVGSVLASKMPSLSMMSASRIEAVPGGLIASAAAAYLNPDPARFTSANGIVHDPLTGLDWSQEELPEAEWDASDAACRAYRLGGFTDWRMPTDRELLTIVDRQRYNPCLPPIFKTEGDAVWSATQTSWTKDKAGSARSFFSVLMILGLVSNSSAGYRLRVRPVRRAVPASQ